MRFSTRLLNRVTGTGNKPQYSTEYEAIIARATALGYTLPSPAQQVKQNALLVALKASGTWNLLDIFRVYANDGSKEFATLNWKNPSVFQATLVNSPTFTINQGIAGNGSTSYINHNYNPATQGVQYTLNNASRYMHIFTAGTGLGLDGTGSTYDNVLLSLTDTAWAKVNSSNAYSAPAVNMVAANNTFLGLNRISSTNITLYKNKTGTTKAQASTAIPSSNLEQGRSFVFYGTHQHSMYAAGASLVSVNDAFQDAYTTYLNSL